MLAAFYSSILQASDYALKAVMIMQEVTINQRVIEGAMQLQPVEMRMLGPGCTLIRHSLMRSQ